MRKKNANSIILICIAILFGLSFYIARSILWTGRSINFETKPVISPISKLQNFTSGGTVILNSDDITSLIGLYLPKLNDNSTLQIESITSSIKDSKITFYAYVKYHKIKLMLSTQGRLDYDNNSICYYPDYFKLGKLTLPKGIVYKLLEKYITVNSKKERVEVDTDKLPLQIESLELKGDILLIKVSKLKSSTAKPIAPSEKSEKHDSSPQNSDTAKPKINDNSPSTEKPDSKIPSNTNSSSTQLKRTSSQLKDVYSQVKTTKEKEIIKLIQDTVNKMAENEDYPFKNDASAVLSKYNKLTADEKSDLKNAIIMNMDIDTLLQLKDNFGL